jgi:hypothetical protein
LGHINEEALPDALKQLWVSVMLQEHCPQRSSQHLFSCLVFLSLHACFLFPARLQADEGRKAIFCIHMCFPRPGVDRRFSANLAFVESENE